MSESLKTLAETDLVKGNTTGAGESCLVGDSLSHPLYDGGPTGQPAFVVGIDAVRPGYVLQPVAHDSTSVFCAGNMSQRNEREAADV